MDQKETENKRLDPSMNNKSLSHGNISIDKEAMKSIKKKDFVNMFKGKANRDLNDAFKDLKKQSTAK